MLVLRQGRFDEFRAGPDDPRQGAVRREWRVLFEGCNAVLDHLDSSLRASREAVARYVAPLGKDSPTQYRTVCCTNGYGENRDPARRALRAIASQLAELIKPTLTEYQAPTMTGSTL